MEKIDFNKLLSESLDAGKQVLGKSWKDVEPYAEHEFKQFAEDAEFLAGLRTSGQIDDTELKHRLDMQKLALTNVLLTIKGIALIDAQNTVNAVLTLVSKAIFSSLGISLPA